MYASINGTRIYFDVEGSSYDIQGTVVQNKPVCFILHGGPGGSHTIFKPHLTPLTKYMQLIYIDNRGSGLSDKGPQSTYSLENNVEDVEALRNYLGLEKVILLGQSYGGMVAMSYAVKYQQNLQALLLLTTSPSYQFLQKAEEFILVNGNDDQKRLANVLWEGGFSSAEHLQNFYQVMEPLYSYSFGRKPKNEKVQFSDDRSYEALNEGFSNFLRTYDVRNELQQINIATLVIGGRHDWITPVDESESIAELIPTSELVIFEESSHLILTDEYEKFHSVVSQFLLSIEEEDTCNKQRV